MAAHGHSFLAPSLVHQTTASYLDKATVQKGGRPMTYSDRNGQVQYLPSTQRNLLPTNRGRTVTSQWRVMEGFFPH